MKENEKRKAPRVPVSMNVDQASGFKTFGFGYATNISEEGIAVDAEAVAEPAKLPSIGDQVRLKFKLPKSNIVIATLGRVIRLDTDKHPPTVAFSFPELTSEFRYEVKRYVSITSRN